MSAKAKTLQCSKPSKMVRNVLVQPFKTKWPQVNGNEQEKLEKMLNKVPHEYLAVGSNAACELLHMGQACVLFLTSNFYPQILGKQIIRMARRNSASVKILAVENLSMNGTREKIIAVRKSDSKDSNIKELLKTMEHISKSNGFDDDHSEVPTVLKAKSFTNPKTLRNKGSENTDQLYLLRGNSKQREFVPNISTVISKKTDSSTNEEWGEYISFKRPQQNQTETELDNRLKQKSVVPRMAKNRTKLVNEKSYESYAPLIVNRVRGNPNRKKHMNEK